MEVKNLLKRILLSLGHFLKKLFHSLNYFLVSSIMSANQNAILANCIKFFLELAAFFNVPISSVFSFIILILDNIDFNYIFQNFT